MLRSLITALMLLPATAFAGIEGYWKTIDDETGNIRSIVEITVADGVATGTIVQLYRQPDEPRDPDCIECKGDLNGKKVIGLDIINGLHPEDDTWSGGTIMDPGNGKTYSCRIEEEGNELKVRGFVGVSLLGRTQTWHRVTSPDLSVRTFLLNKSGKSMPMVHADGHTTEESELTAHLGQ